ncbi:MAG: hypothetical protein EBQ96_10055 [Proteobacteria bacterium]|nr:hypothetical protein [Pseudomonadota bacterium]
MTQPIFDGEPIRYQDKGRWFHNNGFRRRWLANGAANAAVINAARRGDIEKVLAFVDAMGGATQRMNIARSLVKTARALPHDVPGYKIGEASVFMPLVSWQWKGHKQVADIHWLPMWRVGT